MSEGRKYVEPGKIPSSVGLRLELPKIDPGLLNDPSRLDEVVEQKVAGVSQIQKGVTDALEWLASVAIWLALSQPQEGDSPEEKAKKAMKYRIARAEVAKDQEKVHTYVDECLKAEEPVYKMAAAIAYLNFMFGQHFESHESANEMLKNLEDKQLLIKSAKGPIIIVYARYDVSNQFGLEQEDLSQIRKAVEKFSRSYMQLIRHQRQEDTQNLEKQGNLTLSQFLKGIQGKFFLPVPAESYLDDRGEEKWRGGGNLLLELRGKDIIPLGSSGSIEKMVQGMIDYDIRLGHHTLEWDTPPGSGKSFAKVQEAIIYNKRLSKEESETYVRKMQSLWYLITRGIDAKMQEEKIRQLRSEYSQKADITPLQFYGLNGSTTLAEGTAFLEFEGGFKDKGTTFYNVFLLAQRSLEDGISKVQVLDAPGHVRELLGSLGLEQKLEEGENFMKLPPALQRILSAIRSKTDLNAEVAKENS